MFWYLTCLQESIEILVSELMVLLVMALGLRWEYHFHPLTSCYSRVLLTRLDLQIPLLAVVGLCLRINVEASLIFLTLRDSRHYKHCRHFINLLVYFEFCIIIFARNIIPDCIFWLVN